MAQIFISYSRRDTEFVKKLAYQLEEAGFDIWLDTDDLIPGTPNWEQSIRNAIDNAEAILLVASPDSRQSSYVQGELSLAQLRQCPVYPIWANGDEWIESIPLGMVNYQYVDCRGQQFESGLQEVIATMKKVINSTDGLITLSLASHERIQINIKQFETAIDILNHIYLNYLQLWYQPFTYGIDWILGNIETKRLAVPWEWLLEYHKNDRQSDPFPSWYMTWGGLSPSALNIENNSIWAVWELQRLRVGGFAVNSDTIYHRLMSKFGARELRLLLDDECLKLSHYEHIASKDFSYKSVVALMGLYEKSSIFVEQNGQC